MTPQAGSSTTTGRHRFAKIVTEALAPSIIVLTLPIAVAWQATQTILGAVGWGLLVALFSCVIPMAVVIHGARRGRWDGHHVRNREGRLIPFLVCIASVALGLALLIGLHGPRSLVALTVAMLLSLLACLAITHGLSWKISMHTAVSAGAAAVLAITYGTTLLALSSLVTLIGWSRVELKDHTTAQVVAGAALGAVIGGGIFYLAQ